MKKIACIIVTYNRKDLLKGCLKALEKQKYKPFVTYILDNASTDGTEDSIKEWGYYNTYNSNIYFKYIRNKVNEGGAGGFYKGIKTAAEDYDYDGYWVMDDDGVPDPLCLAELVPYLGSFHFISPLVVSNEDNLEMAFYDCSIAEFEKLSAQGVVYGLANPFNAVLFSRKLIKTIGYPKKEMFIWGDEMNFQYRARKADFEIVTIVKARHFHPKDRQMIVNTCFNRKIRMAYPSWKLFCMLRNRSYNQRKFASAMGCLKQTVCLFVDYTYYFVICKHDFSKVILVTKAIVKGLLGDFKGLDKYMK